MCKKLNILEHAVINNQYLSGEADQRDVKLITFYKNMFGSVLLRLHHSNLSMIAVLNLLKNDVLFLAVFSSI